MIAAPIRPHLTFAQGLDLKNERDVRRGVAAYAEKSGRTFGLYHFDDDGAAQAILFFARHCRLTKAEFAGRPFILSPWQAFDVIAPVFGWKCEDDTRRYRQVVVWVPRKNGKTELMAGVSLIHFLGDGEYGGEGYAIATKEDQARIVFDAAKRMVAFSDGLRADVVPFKDSLWCEQLFSAFRPLGGLPSGEHGKGASFLIGDEVHEWKDDRLYQFLAQGMGARRQPIEWLISTAGLQTGYGWELWNTSQQRIAGVISNPRALDVIYAADEDDDPYDPVTWAKANPNLGVSLKVDYMNDQAVRARQSARHENDFKRYHLNLWVGQAKRWLRMDRWAACGASATADAWKHDFHELRGRACYVGVDLASTQDFCAEVMVFPPAGGDGWRVLCRFWLPGADLTDRVRHERAPYDVWAHEGAIVLTEGDAADHDAIKRQILEDMQTYQVRRIGCDPWNAHALMIALNAERADVAMKVPQTIAGMTGGAKLLERLTLTGELDHGNHPVLRWMAANVAVHADGNDNIKPMKNKSTHKIDGIVALIMALALAQSEMPVAQTYLETHSVVVA